MNLSPQLIARIGYLLNRSVCEARNTDEYRAARTLHLEWMRAIESALAADTDGTHMLARRQAG